jgi:hypothetical protein
LQKTRRSANATHYFTTEDAEVTEEERTVIRKPRNQERIENNSWIPGFLIKYLLMAKTHKGECYCGAVAIEVRGAPLDMGYCHCEACRRYSAAPVSAFTLWKEENVNVIKGAEFLGKFKSSEMSDRCYCTKSGGNIMVDHPTLGLIDVRLGALGKFPFKPTVHLNYEESVLPIKDGLPKLKDFPTSIGGSSETMPE